MKHLALVTIICVISFSRQANAQDIRDLKILSFDGSNQKIGLNYDEATEILKLLVLKDTLYVAGVSYIDTVETLSNQFLLIQYGVRGGSGIHVKHALIISVKNDKLIQSFHITSLFNEEFIDFSKKVDTSNLVDVKTVYESTLNLLGNDIQTYKVNIQIHESKMSKQHPSQNYSTNKKFELNFDPDKNIFFSSASQHFEVFDEKTLKESKQYFLGRLPVIELGDFKYYYANHKWYENQQANYFVEYTYHK